MSREKRDSLSTKPKCLRTFWKFLGRIADVGRHSGNVHGEFQKSAEDCRCRGRTQFSVDEAEMSPDILEISRENRRCRPTFRKCPRRSPNVRGGLPMSREKRECRLTFGKCRERFRNFRGDQDISRDIVPPRLPRRRGGFEGFFRRSFRGHPADGVLRRQEDQASRAENQEQRPQVCRGRDRDSDARAEGQIGREAERALRQERQPAARFLIEPHLYFQEQLKEEAP